MFNDRLISRLGKKAQNLIRVYNLWLDIKICWEDSLEFRTRVHAFGLGV